MLLRCNNYSVKLLQLNKPVSQHLKINCKWKTVPTYRFCKSITFNMYFKSRTQSYMQFIHNKTFFCEPRKLSRP